MKKTFIGFSFLLLVATAISSQAATLTVTNTSDSGPGTLRQAILDANADASPDLVTIEFNITGAGVHTIAPLTGFQTVTRPVTIDGYTQPGTSPNTLTNADNAILRIELSGASLGAPAYGLHFTANDCTVRGLVVNRFPAGGSGILVQSSERNLVEGNFVGTDATGTNVLANESGIEISAGAGNRIGGFAPASRNIVSGNSSGIYLNGASNQVFGNFIGLGADGSTVVSNNSGVYLHYCTQTQVGGSAPGARNVISGNAGGCSLNQGGSNVIQGNFIGTDATGNLPRGNVSGLGLNESSHNLIGGAEAGAGNLISGNSSSGLQIGGLNSSSNTVAGNFIGTDVTGLISLSNGNYGIFIGGAPDNLIGGTNAGARNVISGSGIAGIAIYYYGGSTNNAILGNFIGTDVTGTNALPSATGIVISQSSGNQIGGLVAAAGNIIVASSYCIDLDSCVSNQVFGNFIGLAADGVSAVPNAFGVYLGNCSQIQIGGASPDARNVIYGTTVDCGVYGGGNNIIQGNFIGTDASGTLGRGAVYGVYLAGATNNLVGGSAAGEGNLISGNQTGLVTAGIGADNNVVAGNLIGTDVTGTNALGNVLYGVVIEGSGNVIGGTNAGARNVISGNDSIGVVLNGADATNNVVLGNFIGVDITGTKAIANGYGVYLDGALDNLIGGTTPGAGNVISGNSVHGVYLHAAATGNSVQGNFIGTDITGALAISNRQTGVFFYEAHGNLIGGMTSGAGNVIAFSLVAGVAVTTVSATNNAVLGNSFFANGGPGMDLGQDGVTPNDVSDADDGPNHFQNFPEITSVKLIGGDLTVRYRVDSAVDYSAYPLTVEFFRADSAVSGEGRSFIHRHTYDTAQAFANITFTPDATVNDGDPIVATATDANGSTSEFSAVATSTANHPPVVVNPMPDQTNNYGSAFSFAFAANSFSDPDAGDLLSYTASGLPTGIVFDGPTHSFSGIPMATGIFTITVTATDNGTPTLSTNDTFNLAVIRLPITVTNLANSGPGTLRQAIVDAVPGDTINFAVTGTITLSGLTGFGQLVIDKSLTIAGPGATNLAIRGYGGTRLFTVSAGPTEISGLTLTAGVDWFEAVPGGGAILNSNNLKLSSCELTHNESSSIGGAVLNSGSSAVFIATGCTFAENSASYYYGDGGGAIWSDNILRITNCTFWGNYAGGNGGAVDSKGDAIIASSTIVNNSADSGSGGGIFNDGGTLALQNSIVSGNFYFYHIYRQEVGGGITGGDYNLIQYTNGLVVPGTHNVLGLDPILSPLRIQGGQTRTLGLASISPALDVADGTGSPAVDQQGVARPQGTGYDIGAFEGALPPNTTPSLVNAIPDQFTTYQAVFNYVLPANIFNDPDAGQTLTYSASGVPLGLTFDPATRAFTGTMQTAGTNTVIVTVTDDGAPPLSTYTTFHIIAPKLLITARADDASRIINNPDPAFTISYYGLAPGDGPWVIDNPPAISTTAISTSPPGTYPIQISGGSDDVYDLTGWTNGTLTVTLWPLRAQAADASRGVGQTNPPLFGILTGVLYGDNITVTYSSTANPASPAGNYPITPVLHDPDGRLTNYVITLVNGTLTVEADAISPDFEVLHYFGFTNRTGGTAGELTEGSNGWLYGTGGGKNGMGVFRIHKDGSGFLVVRTFSNAEGAPSGSLLWTNNLLLGVSSSTVWSMNPDGTGFVPLHTFGSITNDGLGAMVGLLAASDGMLYGTTSGGGTNGVGTVFRLNRNGSGYAVLHSFDATYAEGFLPSALIEGTNGLLYGTAQSGGPGGYYNGDGTLFRLKKDGSDLTVLHNFTFGATDGAQPMSRLFQGSDGKFYGTARIGGAGFGGIVFRFDDATTNYSVLKAFDSPYYGGLEGAEPIGSLIEGTNDMLYGTTSVGGPSSYGGTVFKVNKDGNSFLVIKQFGPVPDLYSPKYGLLLASDGGLYGATSYGGPSDLLSGGGVFRLSQDGSEYSILYPFSLSGEDGRKSLASMREASDGKVYGTTFSGGAMDRGTVFSMNKDGSGYEVLHSFGLAAMDGLNPLAEVLEGTDGLIYGTTSAGGTAQSGTAFRLNKNGNNFEIMHSFTNAPTDGAGPAGGLLEGDDGLLYGTTMTGGSLFGGTLFVMRKDGSGYSLLHEFDAACYPKGTLVQDTNGVLYGTTSGGGVNSAGTIFTWHTNGTGFSVLYSFGAISGGPFGPGAGLLLASDGALYGTGSGGGQIPGGVFKIQRNGTGFQILHTFSANGLDGYGPFAALAEGGDGRIYGTTQYGGVFNNGTIFRLKPDGSSYCVYYPFPSDVTFFDNKAAFFRGTDGSLYATMGGDLNFGFVYRLQFAFNLPPNLVDAILAQTNTYGRAFGFTFTANTFTDPDAGQTLSYAASGLPPGINFIPATRTFTGTNSEVGSYSVTVTATDNGSPALSANDVFAFIVDKAVLTAVADNQSRSFGDTNPPLTFSYSGFVQGETSAVLDTPPTTSTTATNGSPAGVYPITLSNGVDDHYTLIYSNATLTVVFSVNTQPTKLVSVLTGGTLDLSWPADHIGWRLESQTNQLDTGISVNWTTINGSESTNRVILPIDVTHGSVFFRLVYP